MRRTLALFQVTKKSTGLAGLPVHPNPLPSLLTVYQQTLDLLQKQCPPDAAYTRSVRAITEQRKAVVEKAGEDIQAVERALNAGCVEEILGQAHDELSLLEKMVEWKPWEPLQVQPAKNQWKYFTVEQS